MVKLNSEWGFGVMKKFLIAAGIGALLVVAQSAISAIYNPLDRVVGNAAVAPVASAARSLNPPATAFDTPYAPLDLASGDLAFGSDEITAPQPRREDPVTDRVSGAAGRYNQALDAVSENEACVKNTWPLTGKTSKIPLPRSKCLDGPRQTWQDVPAGSSIRYPVMIIGAAIVATAVVVTNDSGVSD